MTPTVRSGAVVALRLFNLAHGVDLQRAEQLWAERAQGGSARSRLTATPAKAVSFGVPPLELALGTLDIAVAGTAVAATATARLYDFGIVAFALRLPVESLAWEDFARLANATDRAVGPNAPDAVWKGLLERLRGLVGPALRRPSTHLAQEDYLLAVVDALEPPLAAETLAEQVDLVPLMSGETRPLSEGARAELLRHRFSYHPDDLVVLTWDRALIVEPRRDTDVADVLEMANAQLLEMRTYDELLDAELPRMRELVADVRRRTVWLASRRYTRLARRLHTLVGEVTGLTERVDNALQVTEDVYLARVYAAAMDLFRVPVVGAAVDRKLATIRETYTALQGDAAGSRAEILEAAIVAMIAFEIVMSFVRH
jgi:hypothetical protein